MLRCVVLGRCVVLYFELVVESVLYYIVVEFVAVISITWYLRAGLDSGLACHWWIKRTCLLHYSVFHAMFLAA